MKKRVLSALLALCLTLSLAGAAFAENEPSGDSSSAVSQAVSSVESEPQTQDETVSSDSASGEDQTAAKTESTPAPTETPAASDVAEEEPESTPEPEAATEPDTTPAPTEDPVADVTENEESDGSVEYTAALEADGETMNVIVTAPEGAFAEGVQPKLSVTMLTAEDELNAVAGELDTAEVQYDGFAALDITFTDEATGEEVEPVKSVTVRIELPQTIVDSGIDLTTLAVQHLEEDENGNVQKVTEVATLDDGITLSEEAAAAVNEAAGVAPVNDMPAEEATAGDAAETPAAVAEFEVDGFSRFTITWEGYIKSKSIVAQSFTIDGKTIDGPEDFKIDIGDTVYFDKENHNSELDISGYTFDHATYGSGEDLKSLEVDYYKYYDLKYYINGNSSSEKPSNVKLYYTRNSGDTKLTEVDTVDNNLHGINMYLLDYSTNSGNDSIVTRMTGLNSTYVEGGGARQNLVERLLNDNGFPVVAGGGQSLESWFNINSNNGDVTYKQKVNNLFIQQEYDETGYFYYNSAENFATIKDSESKNVNGVVETPFKVYNQLGTPSNESAYYFKRGNFMPFNTLNPNKILNHNLYDLYGKELTSSDDRYNEPIYGFNERVNDFHFGMYMTADFLQPRGGKVDGNTMTFEFTGDDDMWVYIDDVLVLDLGGIHDALNGSINFETGVVTWEAYNDNQPNKVTKTSTLKELFIQAYGENEFNKTYAKYFKGNTFADYSSHTLKMFYMERGAGASNLRIKFNIPTVPSNSLTVEKQVTFESENAQILLGDFEYQFQVIDENGNLLVEQGDPYTVTTEEGEKITCEVGENGIFTLKNGEKALFTKDKDGNAYGFLADNSNQKYYVRELLENGYKEQYDGVEYTITGEGGNTQTTTPDENVNISGFTGFRSAPLTGNMGIGYVQFANFVDEDKLSTLHIRKELMPGTQCNPDTSFNMYVKINNEPVPVGTTYYDAVSEKPLGTVTIEGQISLKADQEVVFLGLVGGSTYSVLELTSEYTVSYTGEKKIGTADQWSSLQLTEITDEAGRKGVQGTISDLNSAHRVTVTNSNYDFYTSLDISKTLNGYQSGEYSFKFNVTPMEKADGQMPVGTEIAIGANGTGTGTVYFGYKNTIPVGSYQYKVEEEVPDETNGITYDDSYYIVTVTVAESGAQKSASVTNVEKYSGESKDNDFTWSAGAAIPFINSVSGDLVITKSVSQNVASMVGKQAYTFTITKLTADDVTDTSFSGSYTMQQGESDPASITFAGGIASNITVTGTGSVTILGLPAGSYKVEENTANLGDIGDEYYFAKVSFDGSKSGVTVNQDKTAATATIIAGEKTEVGVTNNYEQYKTLVITKQVDNGSAEDIGMGDRTQLFRFNTSVNGSSITEITADGLHAVLADLGNSGISGTNQPTAAWWTDGNQAGYSLAHGGTLTITKLKATDEVTFTEFDYGGEGYTTTYKVTSGNTQLVESKAALSGSLDLDDEICGGYNEIQVTFTNNRKVVAPTGLEDNHTKPFGLMVGVAVMAGLALAGGAVVRRRRRWME